MEKQKFPRRIRDNSPEGVKKFLEETLKDVDRDKTSTPYTISFCGETNCTCRTKSQTKNCPNRNKT